MDGKYVGAKYHRSAASYSAQPLYDEVSHKIDNNILSVKLVKGRHRMQAVDEQRTAEPAPAAADVNCLDKYGKRCEKACPKVNVIHNQEPAAKKPEEEMLLLRAIKQITADDVKHGLEVEFKSPRNYTPLPEPGPPPPIIIPKESTLVKKLNVEKRKKK